MMIIRTVVATVLAIAPVFVIAQSCQLPGSHQMAANTTWSGGPNVYNGVIANPAIGTAIYAARDAWDATTAVNRIGDWNGLVSASDCPLGLPMQIGALDFTTANCATNTAYGVSPTGTLAYVDYFPFVCSGCGTKSMTVNLAFAWAVGTTPLPGQYDLQSVMAHEFGHMLGMGHMTNGACVATSPSCAASPSRETMGANVYPGASEICMRDVSTTDKNSVVGLY